MWLPRKATTEEKLTTLPLPCSTITGMTCRQHRNGPLRIEVHGVVPDRKIDVGDRLVVAQRAAGAIEQYVDLAESFLGGAAPSA